jgi:NodT family efflux transporter outer membrane factor (OMF) lipoprotein
LRHLILCLMLPAAACTVGPNYQPPKDDLPAAFARTPAMASVTSLESVDLARWWTAYHDPELDRLVQAALVDSPDVKTALSRLRQARQSVVVAHAQLLPQVNADAQTNYLRFSKNAGLSSLSSLFGGGGGTSGGSSSGSGIALPGDDITTYSVGFDASWEIDIFGGGRRRVESALAQTEAGEWSVRDAQVSLAAEVAKSYIDLRMLQEREQVARDEAERRRRGVSLAANTARAGLAPEGDAIRQRAEFGSAEAAIEPLIAQQAIEIHALGVLLGRSPEALIAELSPAAAQPSAPPLVPPGLPSDLLRRRPDVRAAERRLAAATADIGVAVADLYPHINLTGAAELISSSLANLFTGDSLQLTGNAQAMFPILDFGRRRATVKIRKEQREQAYFDYQKTVLGALKDVEDALVRIDTEQRRNAGLKVALTDSLRASQAVEARYRVGLVDLSAVLQAQQGLLSNRDALASSDGSLRQDLAALFKALGGGWST